MTNKDPLLELIREVIQVNQDLLVTPKDHALLRRRIRLPKQIEAMRVARGLTHQQLHELRIKDKAGVTDT